MGMLMVSLIVYATYDYEYDSYPLFHPPPLGWNLTSLYFIHVSRFLEHVGEGPVVGLLEIGLFVCAYITGNYN